MQYSPWIYFSHFLQAVNLDFFWFACCQYLFAGGNLGEQRLKFSFISNFLKLCMSFSPWSEDVHVIFVDIMNL